MTFIELWEIILSRNPKLKADKTVTMSVENFKKAIKLAYEQGYQVNNYNQQKNNIFEDFLNKKY